MSAAWLVDERWQKAYPIGKWLSIGRGAENGIILRDPAVSRVHATISAEPGGFLLRSFGALGTTVNGSSKGDEHVLREGDRIEIASSTLRFTCLAPDDEMIVVLRDPPVSLDRLETPTRAFPLTRRGAARHSRAIRALVAALALVLGAVLILLALR